MSFAAASEDAAKSALSTVASTVTVITFHDQDHRPKGMTATAFAVASYDPVMAVVCVNASTRTYAGISAANRFGVNTLSRELAHISDHCARPGSDKVLEDAWLVPVEDEGAPPVIAGALAHFDFTLTSELRAGGGVVLLGTARAIGTSASGSPLLHHRGAYHDVGLSIGG